MSEHATRRIILKSEYKNIIVSVDTILYIESIDNYAKVHLADGTSLLSKISLRAIDELLPQGEFIRIHRSYLIPRSRITGFSRTEVTLGKNSVTLPIDKTYIDDVMPLLEEKQ